MLGDGQNRRRTNALSQSVVTSDEILAKLKFLTRRSESQSASKPLSSIDLEQRLVQMRAEVAEIVRKEARSFCNCKQITVIAGQTPEEFEAEMNIACPIHEFRRLGAIVRLETLPPDDEDLRIRELTEMYYRRLREFERSYEC